MVRQTAMNGGPSMTLWPVKCSQATLPRYLPSKTAGWSPKGSSATRHVRHRSSEYMSTLTNSPSSRRIVRTV